MTEDVAIGQRAGDDASRVSARHADLAPRHRLRCVIGFADTSNLRARPRPVNVRERGVRVPW